MQRETVALRGRVVAHRRAVVEFLGDLFENALDFVSRFRLGRLQQALLHHCGRAHQEIAEQMRRNVRPLTDLFGQVAVAFRALDQRGEAAFRQLAVWLSATLCMTSVSPRRTSISVTASPMPSRPAIIGQMRLALGRASSTSSASGNRDDRLITGPATAMSSSCAS
jgi:hypothetical protein